MQIKDKTIVITGAARGIGRALALRFAGQGANIALLDLNAAELEAAAKQCVALGVHASAYTVDVSSETRVAAVLDQVVHDFGALDVIVNNAGIVKDALLVKVKDGEIVGKMTLQQWQAVIDVNLTGVFLCAREAAVRMIKLAKGGVIVGIAERLKLPVRYVGLGENLEDLRPFDAREFAEALFSKSESSADSASGSYAA